MPVYNGATTLAESLQSVAIQADGIEVILVDQASSDDSLSIAKRFEAKLDMTVISAPKNKNWVQNTNLALRHARAPLATMLHQDDIWRPGRADLLTKIATRWPETALWLHAAQYIGPDSAPLGRFQPPFGPKERLISQGDVLRSMLVQNTVALPAAMFRTDAARQVGGLDEDLWYTADWDFWLKLTTLGPVAWAPDALAGFRLHAGSQTVQGSRDAADFARQLEIPVERHIHQVPQEDQAGIRKLADTSNALNVWLAARYHGQKPPLWPVLRKVAGLGPMGAWRLLRRTRLISRVLPRFRLR